MLEDPIAKNRIDQIIEHAVENSLYSDMRVSLETARNFMEENPHLRFTFGLHANGHTKGYNAHTASAQILLTRIDKVGLGMSVSFEDAVIKAIQDIAVESGRKVSIFNRHGTRRVNISPAPKCAK